MFPLVIMDKLLKLKLQILYQGLPIEQARQTFNEIKPEEPPKEEVRKRKRKPTIPAGNKTNE